MSHKILKKWLHLSDSDSIQDANRDRICSETMEDVMEHSGHRKKRAAQRGVTDRFVDAILMHADIERPIGDNCRLMRVSRRHSRKLNIDDRLGCYALIWSDDTARIVTVMPVHDGVSGKRYRKQH